MEKKTLVIVTPGFPHHESDTISVRTQQLFVATAQKLYPQLEIIVLTLQYPKHSTPYIWNGITVIPFYVKLEKILRPLLWLRVYRKLKSLKQKQKLLGILSFWCNETAFTANHFARRNNVQHKIWICGQDARPANLWVRLINPAPNQLVAMSPFLQKHFATSHGIRPEHVVTNAVFPSHEDVARDIDVIGVGSLIPLKNFTVFIQVVASLKKNFPRIRAILIGDGPQKELLMKLIADLDLQGNVEMKGALQHGMVINWMNRSKLLIHPSSYEGYSTACLEALSCGCHVLSFTSAENVAIPHWHIAENENQLAEKAELILKHKDDFSPIVQHTIEDSVKQMLSLFHEER